jgi:hypothetical protein
MGKTWGAAAMTLKTGVSPVDHIGYVECMDEIKERINAIDFALNVPRNPIARHNVEGLALNFRKTFELMVMACQAAHTHLIGRRVKEWRIKNIEQMISRYNPDFFMHAVIATPTHIHDRNDLDVLTMDELKAAYVSCGEWLHAKGPYRDVVDPQKALASFRLWRNKIVNLLNAHRVTIDDSTFLYCAMKGRSTGRTHVSIFRPHC